MVGQTNLQDVTTKTLNFNRWLKASVHQWSTYYNWRLRFEAIRGGFDGDIAIDDVFITPG